MQTAAERAGVTMARGKKKGPAAMNRRQKFRTGIGPVLPTVTERDLCFSLACGLIFLTIRVFHRSVFTVT